MPNNNPASLSGEDAAVSESWNPAQRIGFRFVFVLFTLFIVFENNNAFPFWRIPHFVQSILDSFIPWAGKKLLGTAHVITSGGYGSGDTLYDNVMVLCMILIAGCATVIWSFTDRHRSSYPKMYYWLTVIVRYYLALMLFGYGMVKIIKLQFPSPDILRLSEPYGNSTPMGLAWTFFGYSRGYNLFVGIAEVMSLLLLFRRTMTLGAIITFITTLNIMAVNYFFDVPVKLLSTMLVVMTIFLLLRDLKVLLRFFLTGKPTQLEIIAAPHSTKKWKRITGHSIKFVLVAYALVWSVATISQVEARDEQPKPKLYGLYEINEVTYPLDSAGQKHAQVFPWKQVAIGRSNKINIHLVNDSISDYSLRIFTPDSTFKLVQGNPASQSAEQVYKYDMTDSSNIKLRGRMNGDSVLFVLHRITKQETDFRLSSTGFHWISEKPNNH